MERHPAAKIHYLPCRSAGGEKKINRRAHFFWRAGLFKGRQRTDFFKGGRKVLLSRQRGAQGNAVDAYGRRKA